MDNNVQKHVTELEFFFIVVYYGRLLKILPGILKNFGKFLNLGKFGKMSGSFLRENFGKFSPGFSGIFRV